MTETSLSLLDAVQQQPTEDAWNRLFSIYTPLIHNWLRRHSIGAHDADDIVQEIMVVVVRRIPEFRKQPHAGAFRSWLKLIMTNCLRDLWRNKRLRPQNPGGTDFAEVLNQMEDDRCELSRLWNQEHDRVVTRQLLELIKPQFSESTWQAFRLLTLEGKEVDIVAHELDMTVNAVFIAKSRVLSRLREQGRGLIEEF